MKMVKSLLLGSAAGVVAVSMGQAADLPVKAKPVEYVKVCSLYGAGFYYMPGTDMCIKIGGYVRAETTWGSNGNMTAGPDSTDQNNRITNNFTMRARGYITADAREQTAYGTARAYIAVGIATADTGSALNPSALGLNRAFVQWAGITAGISQSFYDFYNSAAVGYRGYYGSSNTGDPGWWLWAYTAQLGNGLTATISAEQRHTTQIIGVGGPTDVISSGASLPNTSIVNTAGYGGIQTPDFIGNIRLDQTWGGAQLMGAVHEVNAVYYGGPTAATGGSANAGHPSDKAGFVLGAGLRINTPMITQGDYFQAEFDYTQGATRFMSSGTNGTNLFNVNGGGAAWGVQSDCVYGSGAVNGAGAATLTTGCNLTTSWNVDASYEHYWTPQFRESFIFGYTRTQYNAQANAILCSMETFGNGLQGTAAVAAAGCNNNWAMIDGATRFQWDITKSFYIGVEFLYQHYDTATTSTGLLGTVIGGAAIGTVNNTSNNTSVVKDENNLAITARIHKDFLP
jgi:hypothetical protein